MKKKLLLVLTSFYLLSSFAKPNNVSKTNLGIFKDYTKEEVIEYYKDVKENTSKEDLILSLETTLKKDNKEVSSNDGGKSWKYYVLLDRDYTKDPLSDEEISKQEWKIDNVVCSPLYDDSFTFIKKENPGSKVNREHVFPKSYGFANKSGKDFLPYAATDMHNLHMGEANNNQHGHNNYPFGNVADKNDAEQITSSISGKVTGYLGKNKNGIPVYEPLDKDKGDIARSIFYMATRYHTYDSSLDNNPALRLSDTPLDLYNAKKSITASETKDNPATYGMLTDLLSWNELDPVSNAEIHRNNLVYTNISNNRNPFIDYPSWARICFDLNNSEVNKKDDPKTIDNNVDNPKPDPDEPKKDDNKEDVAWYEDLLNPKYYPYYVIGLLIIISFIISLVFKKKRKKRK